MLCVGNGNDNVLVMRCGMPHAGHNARFQQHSNTADSASFCVSVGCEKPVLKWLHFRALLCMIGKQGQLMFITYMASQQLHPPTAPHTNLEALHRPARHTGTAQIMITKRDVD